MLVSFLELKICSILEYYEENACLSKNNFVSNCQVALMQLIPTMIMLGEVCFNDYRTTSRDLL